MLIVSNSIIFSMGIKNSTMLHKKIVESLIRGSFPKYYNVTMTGTIMNRFSKDIQKVD